MWREMSAYYQWSDFQILPNIAEYAEGSTINILASSHLSKVSYDLKVGGIAVNREALQQRRDSSWASLMRSKSRSSSLKQKPEYRTNDSLVESGLSLSARPSSQLS